jgi:transcriptional regulator with XRE-family HTH domain
MPCSLSEFWGDGITGLAKIRKVREDADLLQSELGKKLGRSQSYVSMAERGAIRPDSLQLRDWCRACDTSLSAFVKRLEQQWGTSP